MEERRRSARTQRRQQLKAPLAVIAHEAWHNAVLPLRGVELADMGLQDLLPRWPGRMPEGDIHRTLGQGHPPAQKDKHQQAHGLNLHGSRHLEPRLSLP